jgi:hypothetical protein
MEEKYRAHGKGSDLRGYWVFFLSRFFHVLVARTNGQNLPQLLFFSKIKPSSEEHLTCT